MLYNTCVYIYIYITIYGPHVVCQIFVFHGHLMTQSDKHSKRRTSFLHLLPDISVWQTVFSIISNRHQTTHCYTMCRNMRTLKPFISVKTSPIEVLLWAEFHARLHGYNDRLKLGDSIIAQHFASHILGRNDNILKYLVTFGKVECFLNMLILSLYREIKF